MTMIEQFNNVRRVSTPLVVIRTADAAAVAAQITAEHSDAPVIQWDAAAGFNARNKPAGVEAVRLIAGEDPLILNAADAMHMARKAPKDTIFLVFNAHRAWEAITTAQAIWNLRDQFKYNKRTLVLLTTLEAKPPRELDADVITLDDPLPNEEQLAAIVAEACKNAEPPLPVPKGAQMTKAVDALKGLSSFVAEQIVALALRRNGINMAELWERKIQQVQQTEGATVYTGKEKFSDIGGHDGLKRDMLREVRAKHPVKLIVIFDEFEKMMAGASSSFVGDGGVAKDASQVVLTYMQDHGVRGAILFGHPGAGKTLVAKAMANEADCLCIQADMGAMRGGIVGQSEARVRAFFNLVSAIAGDGGAFFVATCNSTGALTTELRRRFKTGFYFVDLPDRAEKDAIWSIHMKRYGLSAQQRPDDTNWTGAEIEVCCEKADNYGLPLVDVATSIVPVAQSQPELIAQRRREAHGKLLSAATGQTYQQPAGQTEVVDLTEAAIVAPAGTRSVRLRES